MTSKKPISDRKRPDDFHPEVLRLFDRYVHSQITKRDFLRQAGQYCAAGVTATMVLDLMQPNYAWAQQVAPDDPAIATEMIRIPSPDGSGETGGLLVRPAGASGKLPAVLVIHENRGMNPYIEDVARRLGKAGYLAFALDGLTPLGGYPGNDEQGREMQSSMDGTKLRNDFFAGFEFLRDHPDSTGKVGAVGFCYGGGVVNALAVAYPDLAAGVPFYGRQPASEDVPKIAAPLLIHYGGLDERVNAGWPAFQAALDASGKTYEAHIYEGANHGFHNDSTPRYDEAAATLAWDRTLGHFGTYLA